MLQLASYGSNGYAHTLVDEMTSDMVGAACVVLYRRRLEFGAYDKTCFRTEHDPYIQPIAPTIKCTRCIFSCIW